MNSEGFLAKLAQFLIESLDDHEFKFCPVVYLKGTWNSLLELQISPAFTTLTYQNLTLNREINDPINDTLLGCIL